MAKEASPLHRKATLTESSIQVLFGHLPTSHSHSFSAVTHIIMQSAQASGANARCRAMLQSFLSYIEYREFPDNVQPMVHLTNQLMDFANYLGQVRPLNFGMGAAIQFLKVNF